MPIRPHLSELLRTLVLLAAVAGIRAADAADRSQERILPSAARQQIDFARDIEPLLASRCSECHGPDRQESSFRVDRRSALLRGGDSGEPAIIAGHSDKSRLIKFVNICIRRPSCRRRASRFPINRSGCCGHGSIRGRRCRRAVRPMPQPPPGRSRIGRSSR